MRLTHGTVGIALWGLVLTLAFCAEAPEVTADESSVVQVAPVQEVVAH